jgi:hypothetical protein
MNSTCSYTFVEGASCDDGNACTVADTCTAGACTGTPKVCNSPPAAVCVSATDLVMYDITGSCTAGVCVYQKHQTACSGGPCVNNACQVDPCANITCNTPPSVCYGAAGVCQNGSCSYPFANGTMCNDNDPCTVSDACNAGVCKGVPMACTTPPPNVCANASTLQVYTGSGTCSAGTCGYSSSFVSCSAGCANGVCKSSGWTTMTSNTSNTLESVWGSAPNAVWAVGQSGTAVFYDGVQWQVRSPPTSATLWSVHGTAANNVFVTAADYHVYKFDGTSWTIHATLNAVYQTGVFVDGVDSMWIAGGKLQGSASDQTLFRSLNGVVTQVGFANAGVFLGSNGAGIWASSPTDVWFSGSPSGHYNGTTTTAQTVGSQAVWGASSSAVFLGLAANIYRWNGASFDMINTGLGGYVYGLSGTAANRVFAAMSYNGGAVVYYDGVGVTQQSIPAGTPPLYGIWAAPTGEVFAVGANGAIIKGP